MLPVFFMFRFDNFDNKICKIFFHKKIQLFISRSSYLANWQTQLVEVVVLVSNKLLLSRLPGCSP